MRGAPRAIASVAITMALLVALYWLLQDRLSDRHEPVSRSGIFELTIPAPRPGEPPGVLGSSPVFQARQGQTITLKISSELPGSAHVHGYEEHVVLVPNSHVELTFAASAAGIYRVHLHDAEGTMEHIALIEIHPR